MAVQTGSVAIAEAKQTGFLQRRNPCIKLLIVVLVALALSFMYDPATPAAILVVTFVAGWTLGRLGPAAQLRPLWVFVPAGIAILLANILFNKKNGVSPAVVHLGAVAVTHAALWSAGTLWLRLLAFALLSLVFVKTTPPQRLILSLIHQLHMNYRVAFGTMVGYRMLPLLQADYRMIRAAQRVRGVHEARGLLHLWSRTRRYLLPLLTGAVRRGGRVALAMDARAFGALPTRTYRERLVVDRTDWLLVATVVLLLAAIVVVLWFAGVARFTVS